MIFKKVVEYSYRTYTRSDMVFKDHKWRVKIVNADSSGTLTAGPWEQTHEFSGDLSGASKTFADIFGGDQTTYTFDRDKYNISNLRLVTRITKYQKSGVNGKILKREKKTYKQDGTLKDSQPAIQYKQSIWPSNPGTWAGTNLVSSNSIGDGNIVQITETFQNPFGKFLCAIQGDDITECDLGTITDANYNASASNILSA
jgi:hypothetical protein